MSCRFVRAQKTHRRQLKVIFAIISQKLFSKKPPLTFVLCTLFFVLTYFCACIDFRSNRSSFGEWILNMG